MGMVYVRQNSHQVVQDPRDLSEHRSKPESSFGNGDVEEFLDGERVAEFVGHCVREGG